MCIRDRTALGFFYVKSGGTPSSITQKLPESIKSHIEPTPFPFEELTIPYLRDRDYKSSLGDLTKTDESSTHTTYLTSYTSDGLKINGLLTQPKDDMPKGGWPAVIFIHGYIPPTKYKTESNYVSYVNSIARQGFVVFKICLLYTSPFQGVLGTSVSSSSVVEWSTFIAMIVYGVIAIGIIELMKFMKPTSPEEVTSNVDTV